jgi:hypothetical protein
MDLINKLLISLRKIFSNTTNSIAEYVFFKIVDVNKKNVYTLQCVNSKSNFQANILEIILDAHILNGLHPLQSCFIGIEYAKYLKNNKVTPPCIKQTNITNTRVTQKDSQLKIRYQTRRGEICYIDQNTNEEFITYPKDIAFSKNIIEKFHAEQAFYIGVCTGLRMHNLPENLFYLNGNNRHHKSL